MPIDTQQVVDRLTGAEYLGDYEEFIAFAATLQNQACKMRASGAADLVWLLSDAERYVRCVCRRLRAARQR